jgi:hypothetical protein
MSGRRRMGGRAPSTRRRCFAGDMTRSLPVSLDSTLLLPRQFPHLIAARLSPQRAAPRRASGTPCTPGISRPNLSGRSPRQTTAFDSLTLRRDANPISCSRYQEPWRVRPVPEEVTQKRSRSAARSAMRSHRRVKTLQSVTDLQSVSFSQTFVGCSCRRRVVRDGTRLWPGRAPRTWRGGFL